MKVEPFVSFIYILFFLTATGLLGWSASILIEKGQEEESMKIQAEVYDVERIYYNTTLCIKECSWSFPGGATTNWCCQSIEGEDYYRVAIFKYNNDSCVWTEKTEGYHDENYYTYKIGSTHTVKLENNNTCTPVDKSNDYYIGSFFICVLGLITAILSCVGITWMKSTCEQLPERRYYELREI